MIFRDRVTRAERSRFKAALSSSTYRISNAGLSSGEDLSSICRVKPSTRSSVDPFAREEDSTTDSITLGIITPRSKRRRASPPPASLLAPRPSPRDIRIIIRRTPGEGDSNFARDDQSVEQDSHST